MAMQTGVGFSKILILAGAGYTGTILLKNGKLSDMLGELQGLEKTGDQSDDSDALLAQVRRLSTEIRQLASARQITVLNGDSGVKLTSLVIPAATLGALGYGYMWWKGISFSDLFWVTKRNMALAVENLTKHLDSVSDALSVSLYSLVFIFLDLANAGVWYLCNMVGGKKAKMPEALQEQLKLSGKPRSLLMHSGTPTTKVSFYVIVQDDIYNLEDEPRGLHRCDSQSWKSFFFS
ncbi:hypothetical protein GOBAR_DD32563 [Gossypium barbadense]|nr:hypothetical protein GOBAR_DD32563 [Gossypium barbadense]